MFSDIHENMFDSFFCYDANDGYGRDDDKKVLENWEKFPDKHFSDLYDFEG